MHALFSRLLGCIITTWLLAFTVTQPFYKTEVKLFKQDKSIQLQNFKQG